MTAAMIAMLFGLLSFLVDLGMKWIVTNAQLSAIFNRKSKSKRR